MKMKNKTVAILATDGFERSELLEPKQALENAGVKVEIISLKSGEIKSWKDGNWSDSVRVDREIGHAIEADYDALVLPGGVINPDRLRVEKSVLQFVRDFFDARKPVASICHGPQTLISAGVLKGKKMTSYPSIKDDLRNAGANWVDEEVVVDNGLITSRRPADLTAFNKKLLEEIAEGIHSQKNAA